MTKFAKALVPATLACLLCWPIGSNSQPAAKMHRIGMLVVQLPSTFRFSPQAKAFFEGLDQLGYVDGKSVVVEIRSTEGKVERLADVAAELVSLSPDVIWVAICGAPLNAVRQATRTIPIVVATCTDDMVASGIVASLAHPGGNVTGQQKLTPELSAKRLELLKQVAPGAARLAVLWDPGYSDFAADWRALRGAAQSLGVTLLPFEARGPDQWEAAFAAMAAQRAEGLITMQDVNTYVHPQRLADLAVRSGLPAVFPYHVNSNAGGLMSYGVNIPDMFRHSATFIDKILKGVKAGDLPVEQATRIEFLINLKTARALGLAIPQSLLLRADQVIE
jgi:putative tryptophan/tyrosine transport system substrate-binding protein